MGGGLADDVAQGRRTFLSQFPSIQRALRAGLVLDPPHDESTFARSHVDTVAATADQQRALVLHSSLLRLRRTDPALRAAGTVGVEAAVLASGAWVMRFRESSNAPGAAERLLVVNLGTALALDVAPEPLLAPPCRTSWKVLWHSDDPRVGGTGAQVLEHREAWRIPERSAWLLAG